MSTSEVFGCGCSLTCLCHLSFFFKLLDLVLISSLTSAKRTGGRGADSRQLSRCNEQRGSKHGATTADRAVTSGKPAGRRLRLGKSCGEGQGDAASVGRVPAGKRQGREAALPASRSRARRRRRRRRKAPRREAPRREAPRARDLCSRSEGAPPAASRPAPLPPLPRSQRPAGALRLTPASRGSPRG